MGAATAGARRIGTAEMMPTADQIDDAFNAAEDEFGDHKSTVFLASIVAERLGIEYDDVIHGLWPTKSRSNPDPPR